MRTWISFVFFAMLVVPFTLPAQPANPEKVIFEKALEHNYITKYFDGYSQITVLKTIHLPESVTKADLNASKPVKFYDKMADLFMRDLNTYISVDRFWVEGDLAKVTFSFSGNRTVTLNFQQINGEWEMQ